jgi:predicted permease
MSTIPAILFPLFAIAALGYFIGRSIRPDLTTVNRLTVDVFAPALVFAALASKDFRLHDYVPLVLATLLAIVGTGLLGWGVARLAGIQAKTLVPSLMFINAGNLGLPLAVLAFGQTALAPAVVILVVANLMQFTLGIWIFDPKSGWRGIWKVPSIMATVAGVAVGALGIELWPPLLTAVRMVGEVSIPLMLFALGARLAAARIEAVGFGLFGALLRPVVGTIVVWVILRFIELPERERALMMLLGVLPPAVVNFILAEHYKQEPDKVASMVLLGNVAALVTLPIALALVL